MTPPAVAASRYLTPAQVAEQFDVDLRIVRGWIKSGELRAVNLGTRADARKPRWRIAQTDLDLFLSRRAVQPPVKAARRRRQPEGVTEYFQ